jgi:hypothetical protein
LLTRILRQVQNASTECELPRHYNQTLLTHKRLSCFILTGCGTVIEPLPENGRCINKGKRRQRTELGTSTNELTLLFRSGLDDTRRTAYQEINELFHSKNDIAD